MAAKKLKVFSTPVGFHDAYVAAPSQKAALQAWGSDHDLFARGIATLVTDPALAEEPLAHPGVVIKRLRGSAAEQIAALPPDKPTRKAATTRSAKARTTGDAPTARAEAPKPPRPSRQALDAAEQALARHETLYAEQRQELRQREEALEKERRALERSHAREREHLDRAREEAEAAYDRAMKAWRG